MYNGNIKKVFTTPRWNDITEDVIKSNASTMEWPLHSCYVYIKSHANV